jgi:pyruvate,water dikinase
LVAIRSSATAEDLPEASFAGQQETFLNIRGEVNVVNRVKDCFASLFEPRAIFYREQQGFNHFKVGLAAIVQKMVQADTSGVMFTIDPVTNQKNRILIEAIYGLGELLVQGAVTPDRYLVDKHSLKTLEKEVSTQPIQLIKVGSLNKRTKVPVKKQGKPKLTPSQIKELAKLGKKVHRHYYFPQDLEWVVERGKVCIVQTRPVTTVRKTKDLPRRQADSRQKTEKPVIKGQPASPGIGTGRIRIIKSAREINKVEKGDVLVTKMTTPDFVPAMKKVAAIVTDSGGQTSHAAIVSRELGIPCVVGTKEGTTKLKALKFITVDGSTGEIFKGKSKTSKTIEWKEVEKKRPIDRVREKKALKTATKIMVNLAEPELAEDLAQKNVDGVGLLRAEFMMSQIGTHPKKIIEDKKGKIFIKQLKEGIQKIAQPFAPRPVIYRASDFKTNEYRHLTGGKQFEPDEENPFIGYRGAFRYLSEPKVFGLELEAIKQVRKAGFKNLWLMIPFIHQVRELKEIKKLIAGKNLLRSPSFQLWMMVEVPSNVILLEDFIKIGIDGVSIGSNDLTMLLLGVDRDNAELANVFSERDPAVLWALERVIKTARKNKISCSICGQAPSQYPDLVEKLVEWGISSVSVNPDAIETTREIVYHAEGKKIER